MKNYSKVIALALPLLFTTSVFAVPGMKMVCSIEVTGAPNRQEFLTQKMYLTSQPSVEIFGETGEVALGYEGYGAIITNSSKGMIVSMMDDGKLLRSTLIPYSKPEFKVSAKIENLKFNRLNLDCGEAVGDAK